MEIKPKFSNNISSCINNYHKNEFTFENKINVHYAPLPEKLAFFKVVQKINNDQDVLYIGKIDSYSSIFMGALKVKPKKAKLNTELSWAIFSLSLYKNEIIKFCEIKKNYESHLLVGNYLDATNSLELIKETCGYSLWLAQNELLLAQLNDGFKGNRGKLKEIEKSIGNERVGELINSFSEKFEDGVSPQNYRKHIDNVEIDTEYRYVDYKRFIKYQLDPINYKDDKFEYLLQVANTCSFIDLYETTTDVLMKIIARNNLTHLDNINVYIKIYLEIFSFDIRNLLILNTLIPKRIIATKWHKEVLIPILDLYTDQKYQQIIKMLPQLINQKPTCFEFYDIYLKSIIAINNNEKISKDIFNITQNDSIINVLLYHLYNVLIKNDLTSHSLIALEKLSLTFSTFNIGYCFNSFCKTQYSTNEEENDQYYFNIGLLSSEGGTPRFSMTLPDEQRKQYLESFSQQYGKVSSSLPYNLDSDREDTNREILYRAEDSLRSGYIDIAKKLFEKLIIEKTLELFHVERVISGLFNCYRLDKDFTNILILLSEVIVLNKYHLFPLKQQVLEFYNVLILEPKTVGDIDYLLNKAILIHYSQSIRNITDEHELYTSYAFFMEEAGFDLPEDLINNIHLYDDKKIHYFLANLCTTTNLEISEHTDDEYSCVLIRLDICKYLMKSDDIYKQEALDLQQSIDINNLMLKVSMSKIYVDVQAISKLLSESFLENFSRYRQYANSSFELNNQIFYDDNKDGLFNKKTDNNVALLNSNSQNFDMCEFLFNSMFTEIAENFTMHHQHGLIHYTSDQIKHGGIELDLWSVFVENSLVTKVEKNKYVENKYWEPFYRKENKYEYEKFQVIIKDLSKSVKQVINTVLYEWLIVDYAFVENNIDSQSINESKKHQMSKSMLNYIFTHFDTSSYLDYIPEINTAESMCDFIFEKLWQRTDHCLMKIKLKIETDLKNTLEGELNHFELQVSQLKFKDISEIEKAISECRIKLTQTINYVSSWFQHSEEQQFKGYDLNMLVETCLRIIRNTNSSFLKGVIPKGESKYEFPGKTFIHFLNVITIFLRNILIHATEEMDSTLIEINEDEKFVIIQITNKLNPNTDIEILKNILDSLDKDNDNSSLVTEKGQGLKKAKWTMLYQFSLWQPDFDIQIDDHNLKCAIKLCKVEK